MFSHLTILTALTLAADTPKSPQPVELIGTARDYKTYRDWNSYYWRDDFTFFLKEEKTGKTWRILSREPTPAYHWRMGPTTTGLKIDWAKSPRVKAVGVAGVDRLPPKFYELKLDDANIATVLVLFVESAPGKWQEYYVNNWFHKWSEQADLKIYALHADKPAPYDIYGFINGQAAPFSSAAQTLIGKYPKARMFHGLIKTTKANPFGYEIDLIHLVGPDEGGNGVVFHGDPKTLPLLDGKK